MRITKFVGRPHTIASGPVAMCAGGVLPLGILHKFFTHKALFFVHLAQIPKCCADCTKNQEQKIKYLCIMTNRQIAQIYLPIYYISCATCTMVKLHKKLFFFCAL